MTAHGTISTAGKLNLVKVMSAVEMWFGEETEVLGKSSYLVTRLLVTIRFPRHYYC